MHAKALGAVRQSGLGLEPIQVSAEDIPLGNHCVNTVVVTYSLCTIKQVPVAMLELRRELKSNGNLLFCERRVNPSRRFEDDCSGAENGVG